MSQPTRVVAILTANCALSSVIAMVLTSRRHLRVRRFETRDDLVAYMRIAPVDLLVCDYELEASNAEALACGLRTSTELARREFQIVALAREVTPRMKRGAVRAGIDEVIVKPMSPRHLLERVEARLGGQVHFIATRSAYVGPERRDRVPFPDPRGSDVERRGGNVIQLFGATPPAQPEWTPPRPA